jgi:hypothetical protein
MTQPVEEFRNGQRVVPPEAEPKPDGPGEAEREPEPGPPPAAADQLDPVPWPRLPPDAYHGLAGDFVRVVEPHSEADPAALLVQFLTMFGNVVGRGPYCVAEADEHFPNLFAVFIGATAKARKGTSYGRVRHLFGRVAEEWVQERIRGGLSSGEGLIFQVRDPDKKDEGVLDKRILIFEPEFALVLKVIVRDGNTLTAIMRQAWDTGTLRTMPKSSLCATGAHVSIIGHITVEELRRYITETELASGFANRFLWLCARRSKCLPRDEDRVVPEAALLDLVERLREALIFAHGVHVMGRDREAKRDWERVYPTLSSGRPGLLGAATSRAEAQVLRLETLYALLDNSDLRRRPHLRAALAVWEYAEASAKFVFGAALGDPVADAILDLLRSNPMGLTRTEIYNAFARNKPREEITRALRSILMAGAARFSKDETGGRPTERWFAM